MVAVVSGVSGVIFDDWACQSISNNPANSPSTGTDSEPENPFIRSQISCHSNDDRNVQELEEQLLDKEKEAAGLREDLGRRVAKIVSLQEDAARLKADAEATIGRAEHALSAETDLLKQEAADLRNR